MLEQLGKLLFNSSSKALGPADQKRPSPYGDDEFDAGF